MPLDPTTPISYLVTDGRTTEATNSSSAEFTRLFVLVGACVEAGVSLVQLREKAMRPRVLYELTRRAADLTRGSATRLLVNDRADIALALGADGVHLGQHDLDPVAARRLLGDRFIIGYSTHSVAQAVEAARLPLDYIAIGPIFATRTKENPDPAIGLDGLRQVRAAIDPSIPLVAIGGITHANARATLDAGANSVALVSALLDAPDLITQRTRELIKSID